MDKHEEMMKNLDMPKRKETLPPEKLLQLVPIKENDTIFELENTRRWTFSRLISPKIFFRYSYR
ncbi:hypothetical protein IEC97_18875 [Neobacillus cucumis]|uniref:hypothetical protein n=1 Tax=Neobacillus cucumis TaxID=1740721 RepID=UPI0018E032D1|nr:hypothetical protein [Neobacillus cucumis]MBI0579441.1 hypothetical protein [Neobacillus cucumis]